MYQTRKPQETGVADVIAIKILAYASSYRLLNIQAQRQFIESTILGYIARGPTSSLATLTTNYKMSCKHNHSFRAIFIVNRSPNVVLLFELYKVWCRGGCVGGGGEGREDDGGIAQQYEVVIGVRWDS